MSQSTRRSRNRRRRGRSCLVRLLGVLLVLGLVFYLVGGLSRPAPKPEPVVTPQPVHMDPPTGQVQVDLTRDQVQGLIDRALRALDPNPFQVSMSLTDDQLEVQGRISVYNQSLPVKVAGSLYAEEGQVIYSLDRIGIGSLPLPVSAAYDQVQNQVPLPPGIYYHPDQPRIRMDLGEILGLEDPSAVQARALDISQGQFIFWLDEHLASRLSQP